MLTKTIRKVINGIMEILGKEKTAKEVFYDTELTNHWIEIIAWKVKEALPKEELPDDLMLKMYISEQLKVVSFPEHSPMVEIYVWFYCEWYNDAKSEIFYVNNTNELLKEIENYSKTLENYNGKWKIAIGRNIFVSADDLHKFKLKELQYIESNF